jgi:hypothetical protein
VRGEHHHDFHIPSPLLFTMNVRLHWTAQRDENRSFAGIQLDEGMIDTLVSVKMDRRLANSG